MFSKPIFFHDSGGLVRILVVAPLAYAVLVLTLRISGKRTLSKLNAFDLVVTVALGSTLASIITSKELPLADGALALVVLVALQLAVSWTAQRVAIVSKVVNSEPRLVFLRGHFLEQALEAERLQKHEVVQAMRTSGHLRFAEVEAVVLETDGSLSVVSSSAKEGPSTLSRVRGAEPSPGPS